jgi:hypothetical protein
MASGTARSARVRAKEDGSGADGAGMCLVIIQRPVAGVLTAERLGNMIMARRKEQLR